MLNSLGEVALLRGDLEGLADDYEEAQAIEADPEHLRSRPPGPGPRFPGLQRPDLDQAECDRAGAILAAASRARGPARRL